MIGVDVGGTFTDVVRILPDGRIAATKVASDPTDPATPVVEGAYRLGVEGVEVFNHASTMGLNAVITRRLPKIAFLTTEGHRDMLDRGRLRRPLDAQTDPSWRRPFGDAARPLVPRYLRRGISGRILADGSVLADLDADDARRQLGILKRCGVVGVAVCLLNAYVNPAHEQRLREITREVLGDIPISISSETSPLAKEYARASTTVVDVLMKLIFTRYSREVHDGLLNLGFTGDLNFADCAATLVPWREALQQPFRIVFAGPAAGTVSSSHFGNALGDRDLICADVGGTSTDVSIVVGGQPVVSSTFEIEHDLVINALSTEIASVGAGGGSIIAISSTGNVSVGPDSAGSVPGPACYGRGGAAPTVTDACLLMGVLDPERFADGELLLDSDLARTAFQSLETPLTFEQRVRSAFHIAVSNLAEEIANVTIRHGVDPRDFSLVAYGAAGGMLIPAALDLLHVKRVLIPPHPGLFSALGLLSSDLVFYESRSAYVILGSDSAAQIAMVFEDMEERLLARVGVESSAMVRRSFDGRLFGQTWETPFVAVPPGPVSAETVHELIGNFHDEYERRNGNRFEHLPVEGVTYRVEIVVPSRKVEYLPVEQGALRADADRSVELRYFAETPLIAEEHRREALADGCEVVGPALIREPLSTIFVCPGQIATVGAIGEISITRQPS